VPPLIDFLLLLCYKIPMMEHPQRIRQKKAELLERTIFDPLVDIDIIGAYKTGGRSKVTMRPTQPAMYRCYFFENKVMVTYLTHLLGLEHDMFMRIINGRFNDNPTISVFVLRDGRVLSENNIDAGTLAHVLFRFHHRIAKKYIVDEIDIC